MSRVIKPAVLKGLVIIITLMLASNYLQAQCAYTDAGNVAPGSRSISCADGQLFVNDARGLFQLMGGVVPATCSISDNFTDASAPCGVSGFSLIFTVDGVVQTPISLTVNEPLAPSFTSALPNDITVDCTLVPALSNLLFSNASSESGNCIISGMAQSTQTAHPGACGGMITETWTIPTMTNCNRGDINHTRTITVNPASAPVITGLPATSELLANCTDAPTIPTVMYSNGVTGDCNISGTLPLTGDTGRPTSPCGGTRTYTFSGDVGPVSCQRNLSHTFVVTYPPAPAPIAMDQIASTGACTVGLPLTGSTITATNSLGGQCARTATLVLQAYSHPGACGGNLELVWTGMDDQSCAQITHRETIAITPAPAPTLTNPGNITVNCDAIPMPSSTTYTNGQTNTNCLISGTTPLSVIDPHPGACGGTIQECWTVSAVINCNRGQLQVCRNITVNPASAPAFTTAPLPGDITVVGSMNVPAVSMLTYDNGEATPCRINGMVESTQAEPTGDVCEMEILETWIIPSNINCSRGIVFHTRTITVLPFEVELNEQTNSTEVCKFGDNLIFTPTITPTPNALTPVQYTVLLNPHQGAVSTPIPYPSTNHGQFTVDLSFMDLSAGTYTATINVEIGGCIIPAMYEFEVFEPPITALYDRQSTCQVFDPSFTYDLTDLMVGDATTGGVFSIDGTALGQGVESFDFTQPGCYVVTYEIPADNLAVDPYVNATLNASGCPPLGNGTSTIGTATLMLSEVSMSSLNLADDVASSYNLCNDDPPSFDFEFTSNSGSVPEISADMMGSWEFNDLVNPTAVNFTGDLDTGESTSAQICITARNTTPACGDFEESVCSNTNCINLTVYKTNCDAEELECCMTDAQMIIDTWDYNGAEPICRLNTEPDFAIKCLGDNINIVFLQAATAELSGNAVAFCTDETTEVCYSSDFSFPEFASYFGTFADIIGDIASSLGFDFIATGIDLICEIATFSIGIEIGCWRIVGCIGVDIPIGSLLFPPFRGLIPICEFNIGEALDAAVEVFNILHGNGSGGTIVADTDGDGAFDYVAEHYIGTTEGSMTSCSGKMAFDGPGLDPFDPTLDNLIGFAFGSVVGNNYKADQGCCLEIPINTDGKGVITIRHVFGTPITEHIVCGDATGGLDLLEALPIGAIPWVGPPLVNGLQALGCSIPFRFTDAADLQIAVIDSGTPEFVNCGGVDEMGMVRDTLYYTFSEDLACDTEVNWSIPQAIGGCDAVDYPYIGRIVGTDASNFIQFDNTGMQLPVPPVVAQDTQGVYQISGPIPGSDLDVGFHEVMYEAVSCCGARDTCTIIINVRAGDPVLRCPADITVRTDSDECDTQLVGIEPLEGVGCQSNIMYQIAGATTLAQTAYSTGTSINVDNNHLFNLGVSTVTYTMTIDINGDGDTADTIDGTAEEQTCSFMVTVEDEILPVAECRDFDIQINNCNFHSIYAAANDAPADSLAFVVDAGSADNCGIQEIQISRDGTNFFDVLNFDCSDKGTNIITLLVTDDNGNTSTCQTSINVVDFWEGFEVEMDLPEACFDPFQNTIDFAPHLRIISPTGTDYFHEGVQDPDLSDLHDDASADCAQLVTGIFTISSWLPDASSDSGGPNPGSITPDGVYSPADDGWVTITYTLGLDDDDRTNVSNTPGVDDLTNCFLIVHDVYRVQTLDPTWNGGPICCDQVPIWLGGANNTPVAGLNLLTDIGGSYPMVGVVDDVGSDNFGQWSGQGVEFVDPDGTDFSGDEYFQFVPTGLDGPITVTYTITDEPCEYVHTQEIFVSCQDLHIDNFPDVITLCPNRPVEPMFIQVDLNDYGANDIGTDDLVVTITGLEAVSDGELLDADFDTVSVVDGVVEIPAFTSIIHPCKPSCAQYPHAISDNCTHPLDTDGAGMDETYQICITTRQIFDQDEDLDNDADDINSVSGDPFDDTLLCEDMFCFDIRVVDTEPPVFDACPREPIVVDAPIGWCQAYVNFDFPIALDGCIHEDSRVDTFALVEQVDTTGFVSGDLFPVGLTTLAYLATDEVGNTSYCEFQIIVNDFHTPPIISCPPNVKGYANDLNQCNAVVTTNLATLDDFNPDELAEFLASGEPGDISLAPILLEDNCLPDKHLAVTYEAFDEEGNTILCGFDDITGQTFPVGTTTVKYKVQDQPLLLITEIKQDGSSKYAACIEITNFGPAAVDVTGLLLEVKDADRNLIDQFIVPSEYCFNPNRCGAQNCNIVLAGETFSHCFEDDPADPADTAPTRCQETIYCISFGDNNIDEAPINTDDTDINWVRTSICDHNTPNDFVATNPCDPGSFDPWPGKGGWNPEFGPLGTYANPDLTPYDPITQTGFITGLQSEAPSMDMCEFTVEVLDWEAPTCIRLDTIAVAGTTGSLISDIDYMPHMDGECLTATASMPTGLVGDVNLNDLQLAISGVGEMTIKLTSPNGTRITLIDEICGATANVDISLDDSDVDFNNAGVKEEMSMAYTDIPCAPLGGAGKYMPRDAFKAFYGEQAEGDWILEIFLSPECSSEDFSVTGTLNNWELEILYQEKYDLAEQDIVVNHPELCLDAEYSNLSSCNQDKLNAAGLADLSVNPAIINRSTHVNRDTLIVVLGNELDECKVSFSWVHPVFEDNCCGGTMVATYDFINPTTGVTTSFAESNPDGVFSFDENGDPVQNILGSGAACDGKLQTYNFPVGCTQITYDLEDDAGNQEFCVIRVIVLDKQAPILFAEPVTDATSSLSCMDQVIQLGPTECSTSIEIPELNIDYTDNCTIDSIRYEYNNQNTFAAHGLDPFGSGDIFDPTNVPVGVHEVTLFVTDIYCNVSQCDIAVEIIEHIPSGTLACNGRVNISLDGNCEYVLSADHVLEGNSYRCYENYCFEVIEDKIGAVPRVPDSYGHFLFTLADVGKVFKYSIGDCDANNTCWGEILIEEKQFPIISFPDDVQISCSDSAEPDGCSYLKELADYEIALENENQNSVALATAQTNFDLIVSQIQTLEEQLDWELAEPFRDHELIETLQAQLDVLYLERDAAHLILTNAQTNKDRSWAIFQTAESDYLFKKSLCDDLDEDGDAIVNVIGMPVLLSCESAYQFTFGDRIEIFDNCDDIVKRITRTWEFKDDEGNIVTHDQIIEVLTFDLDDVVFPADYTGVNALDCEDVFAIPSWTSPDSLGYPMVYNQPVNQIGGGICSASFNVYDEVFDVCGGEYEILRYWKVRRSCGSVIAGINPREHVQVIKVVNPTAPVISNDIPDINASIAPWSCIATVELPLPNRINEPCSDLIFDANIFGGGDISWTGDINDGSLKVVATSLIEGLSYNVIYSFKDECHSVSTDVSFNINVVDENPPVPVCEDRILVSLTPNDDGSGFAKVYAKDFDNGSHDSGCGGVTFSVIRMEDFATEIYNCNDEFLGYESVSCAPSTIVALGAEAKAYLGNTFDPALFDATECIYDDPNIDGIQSINPVSVTNFGDIVTFCCDDIGQELFVVLRVTDAFGNTNDCMVQVELSQKLAPVMVCPADVTIECDQSLDTAINSDLGIASAIGLCADISVNYMDQVDIGNCGIGTVRRSWYPIGITDSLEFVCTQLITIQNNEHKFDPSTIKFPPHQTGDIVDGINLECTLNQELSIEAKSITLPPAINCAVAQTCIPEWTTSECGLVGYSIKTDTVYFEDDACIKILNHWSVIDWCTYDPTNNLDDSEDVLVAYEDWSLGVCKPMSCFDDETNIYFGYAIDDNGVADVVLDGKYDFTQVIKVVNDHGPIMSSCEDRTVSVGSDCAAELIITKSATDPDECASQKLYWTIEVLANDTDLLTTLTHISANDESITINVSDELDVFAAGTTIDVKWTVSDGCTNISVCEESYTFVDEKAPTPLCIQTVSTATMNPSGNVTIWASDFNLKSEDNCTRTTDLRYSFSGDEIIDNMTFNCDSLAGEPSKIFDVQVWVWDELNQRDYCNAQVLVDDNQNACSVGSSTARISGHLFKDNPEITVIDAEVFLNTNLAGYPKSYGVDDYGKYSFDDNPLDVDYSLWVVKDNDYLNGVSTLDLVMLQRHILGLVPLTEPLQLIAADVTNNGTISTSDIVELRQLILGIKQSFGNNHSWRFVQENTEMNNAQDAMSYSDEIRISKLQGDLDINFNGIKVGDLNGSVSIDGFTNTEVRSNKRLSLKASNTFVSKGDYIYVTFDADAIAELYGFQFTLEHTGMRLVDVLSDQIDINVKNHVGKFDDRSTFSWNSSTAITAGQDLFTLVFDNEDYSGLLSELLKINSKLTIAEGYITNALEVMPMDLEFVDLEEVDFASKETPELFQNVPNPFNEVTSILFKLPNGFNNAVINVYDANGKLVKSFSDNFKVGVNEIQLNKNQIGSQGFYIYELEVDDVKLSKGFTLVR